MGTAVAVVLAGCGGDGDGGADAADDGPLAEFFGEGVIEFSPGGGMGMSFSTASDFEIPEEELARMREVEELVAECMVEEGFEYTANVVNPEKYVSPWQEAQELPPDEFAEQYGYGVSTMHYSEIEQDLPPDPNQEYRESLSEEAAQAYERALYGAREAWSSVEGKEPPPPEERGCYGAANAEIYGEDPMAEMQQADPWTEFEGLMNDISSLNQRIHTDPRLGEAGQAWVGCMADAGYPDFERVGDAQQSIYQRMGELEGWDMPESEPTEAPSDAAAEDSSDESAVPEPPQIDPEELADLQEHEIELAVADRECMAEHYDDIYAEVSHELQEEFVTEHRSELERYRDWAEKNDFSGGFGFGRGSAVRVD